jgi:hypothetical protein
MSEPSPIHKARSGSQKRQRQHRHVMHTDDAEEARFQAKFADWRASKAAVKHGDSEAAFIRYMTIGEGARPLPKAKQRTGPRFNPDLTYELASMLGRIMTELMRIGGNMNQIAHHLNAGRGVSPDYVQTIHEEMREALQAIRRALWWAD